MAGMASRVETTDRLTAVGRKMMKQAAVLDGKPHVKVGFPERAFNKVRKEVKAQKVLAKGLGFTNKEIENLGLAAGLTVGEIAVISEFGSADGQVPERSTIRAAFDQHHRDYYEATKKLKLAVLLGKVTSRKALNLIGLMMESDIRTKYTEGGVPLVPNAPSTIARKGSSHPLIDTGQTRASVTHVVVSAD